MNIKVKSRHTIHLISKDNRFKLTDIWTKPAVGIDFEWQHKLGIFSQCAHPDKINDMILYLKQQIKLEDGSLCFVSYTFVLIRIIRYPCKLKLRCTVGLVVGNYCMLVTLKAIIHVRLGPRLIMSTHMAQFSLVIPRVGTCQTEASSLNPC